MPNFWIGHNRSYSFRTEEYSILLDLIFELFLLEIVDAAHFIQNVKAFYKDKSIRFRFQNKSLDWKFELYFYFILKYKLPIKNISN